MISLAFDLFADFYYEVVLGILWTTDIEHRKLYMLLNDGGGHKMVSKDPFSSTFEDSKSFFSIIS